MLKQALFLTGLLLIAFLPTVAAQSEPEAGETRLDDFGIEQVWVPAGCFMMGADEQHIADLDADPDVPSWVRGALPSEQPAHEVCITEGYWLDKTEVTFAAFDAFVEAGGYTTPDYWSEDGLEWLSIKNIDDLPLDCIEDAQPDFPRVCITWFEAEAYAAWRGGALPTEAEWEYAARGPEALIYPWGNTWDASLANVVDSESLMPVGSYPEGASWVGALDMAGNAMEWAQDWLDADYYAESPIDDPAGPERGRIKVERGGWWGSNPYVARTTYRHFEDPPAYKDEHIGFRIVSR